MIRCYVAMIAALLFVINLSAQTYDLSYFDSPVNHPVKLSGSFGELRTNHFHLGIDIKSTNGRSGDPILAAADGIISRISIGPSGFGNAVYIDHDNGYTTVYAHLSALSDTLANYVKAEQYKSEQFPQQLKPDSTFYVKKGQEIGRMGNSGRSFGPHLHFEIRETKTEVPVNPFLFGIKPTDKRPPVFKAIRFYDCDSSSVKGFLQEKKINNLGSGIYSLDSALIKIPAAYTSMSVLTYDQMDGAYNKNGVYQMKVLIDNKVRHGFKMDKVSYEEGHYINALIDYAEKQKSKRQFSNCFTYPVDSLSIYKHKEDRNGIINLDLKKPKNVKIELQDFDGNVSELSFKLVRENAKPQAKYNDANYLIQNNERNIIRLQGADIIFKAQTFLDDQALSIRLRTETTDGINLPSFEIGNASNPVFKPFNIYLKALNIPDSLRNHFTLYKCDDDKNVAYAGDWQDSTYVIRLDELGSYQCGFDFTPPTIQPINLQPDMTNQSSIKLKITDNFEPGTKNLRLQYEGSIDGNWVLFESDLKNDLIYYKFDDKCPPGKHMLNLTVKDNRGNTEVLSYQFSRN